MEGNVATRKAGTGQYLWVQEKGGGGEGCG